MRRALRSVLFLLGLTFGVHAHAQTICIDLQNNGEHAIVIGFATTASITAAACVSKAATAVTDYWAFISTADLGVVQAGDNAVGYNSAVTSLYDALCLVIGTGGTPKLAKQELDTATDFNTACAADEVAFPVSSNNYYALDISSLIKGQAIGQAAGIAPSDLRQIKEFMVIAIQLICFCAGAVAGRMR